jgi:TolB protein
MTARKFALLAAALLVLAGPARAQLTIEIIGGGANQIPVAVLPFVGEAALPHSVTEIVEQDLTRSGRFRTIFVGGVNPLPSEMPQVNFADWKSRLADALIIGQARRVSEGRFEVRFRLLDVQKQAQLGEMTLPLTAPLVRVTAHKIADFIYEKLTGERGVFTTQIAYVVKEGARYELRVADSDGENAQKMVTSSEPIMSPSWSPDGTRMAYVSFQNKKPILFVQSLAASKQPAPVANYRGSNSAPAWSPDGKQLAAVLTRDGTSQIYLMNADGSNLRRLSTSTTSGAIDTEPFFTPDGQSIYFTSDRGGSPQIYRMAANGGEATRITFDGDYNVSPRVSPDGKTLAYISRISGRFQLMAMDLESKQILALTDGLRDESPTFAPNGRILLYASDADNRGVLATVSSDGRFKTRLRVAAGDVREPAWGPFLGR